MIGQELVYLSPLRAEKTPSFHVNQRKNTFNDFGGDEEMKGDSIRFVQLFKKCSFREAVAILLSGDFPLDSPFSFSGKGANVGKPDSRIVVTRIGPLRNRALIRYVTNRGILLKHAFDYLEEVHFAAGAREYFAVGFKNDGGGYELRNGLGFKGKTANGITVLSQPGDSVSLFEGFFDFLSALRYYGQEKPTNTAIILNTVGNLKAALPILRDRRLINCFLDNDIAGEKVVQKLENLGFNLKNWSQILYPNRKDFNDFIVSTSNTSA